MRFNITFYVCMYFICFSFFSKNVLAQSLDKQQLLNSALRGTAEASRNFLRRDISHKFETIHDKKNEITEHDNLLDIIADTLNDTIIPDLNFTNFENMKTDVMQLSQQIIPFIQETTNNIQLSTSQENVQQYYAKNMICHVHDNKIRCSSINIDDIVFNNNECTFDAGTNNVHCERNLNS